MSNSCEAAMNGCSVVLRYTILPAKSVHEYVCLYSVSRLHTLSHKDRGMKAAIWATDNYAPNWLSAHINVNCTQSNVLCLTLCNKLKFGTGTYYDLTPQRTCSATVHDLWHKFRLCYHISTASCHILWECGRHCAWPVLVLFAGLRTLCLLRLLWH